MHSQGFASVCILTFHLPLVSMIRLFSSVIFETNHTTKRWRLGCLVVVFVVVLLEIHFLNSLDLLSPLCVTPSLSASLRHWVLSVIHKHSHPGKHTHRDTSFSILSASLLPFIVIAWQVVVVFDQKCNSCPLNSLGSVLLSYTILIYCVFVFHGRPW